MAEQDGFVSEVNEDVRQEQFFKTLKRYRYVIAGVVVGVLALVAGNEWRQGQMRSGGEALYQATNDLDATADVEGYGGFVALAQAHSVGFNALAERDDVERALRDLAALQQFSQAVGEVGAPADPEATFLLEARLVEVDLLLQDSDVEGASSKLIKILERDDIGEMRAILETVLLSLGGEIPETLQQDEAEESNG